MDIAFERYQELVRRIDEFTRRVTEACPGEITCGPGCDECCGRTFSVFQVEAENLLVGFGLLCEKDKYTIRKRLGSRKAGPCILLDGGRCMLYAYRPIICRTHGLPLVSGRISVNGVGTLTLCERNFTTPGSLEDVPKGMLLDLDSLNAILAAVNMLFMKERAAAAPDYDNDARVLIPDIFGADGDLWERPA